MKVDILDVLNDNLVNYTNTLTMIDNSLNIAYTTYVKDMMLHLGKEKGTSDHVPFLSG